LFLSPSVNIERRIRGLAIEERSMTRRKVSTPHSAKPVRAVASGRNHAANEPVLELDADAWATFIRALDNPPPPNQQLKSLMARRPPWLEN
jgi:hypothetical protein